MSKWSLRADCCAQCKTTERKHQGFGLCTRCYCRDRLKLKGEHVSAVRAEYRARFPQKVRAAQRASVAKKREYYDRYKTEWRHQYRTKWPIGGTVEVKLGTYPVRGVIESVYRGKPWRLDVRLPKGYLMERVLTSECLLISKPSFLEAA